jgi:hypothetical protein
MGISTKENMQDRLTKVKILVLDINRRPITGLRLRLRDAATGKELGTAVSQRDGILWSSDASINNLQIDGLAQIGISFSTGTGPFCTYLFSPIGPNILQVVDPAGKPVPHIAIRIGRTETKTDAWGQVSWQGPLAAPLTFHPGFALSSPGWLQLTPQQSRNSWQSARVNGDSRAARWRMVIVEKRSVGSLGGLALDTTGKRLGHYAVALFPADARENGDRKPIRTDAISSLGRFFLEGIPPGRYRLRFSRAVGNRSENKQFQHYWFPDAVTIRAGETVERRFIARKE